MSSALASATMVVMERDGVVCVEGVLFFSNAEWLFVESCDIIDMSPLGRGFLLHFPGARGRGPHSLSLR